jgi:pyrroloquinoline quinone (PQQ) biosynthesis protein C
MTLLDEQLDRYVGNGSEFERMLHALIHSEAFACGIPPHEIDWDFRPHVRDAGKDILVRTGNLNAERRFIPNISSVWSAKSGQDGLNPRTLRNEIETHVRVQEHLRAGGAYVWCAIAAANNDARDNLRAEADALVSEFKLNRDQIVLFFRDTITQWLNEQIGVASIFFELPRGWKTLLEWERRDKNFGVTWVGFGSRPELLSRIQTHLLASSGENVLHIAGWSGVGKTRTVLEACRNESALEGVLYFPRFEDFIDNEDYFLRTNSLRAAIVVDEVELGQSYELLSRVSGSQGRLRIITVGPALSHNFEQREDLITFPTPNFEGGVCAVIRAADPKINADQISHIASFAEHDLRLALVLVEANQRDPFLANSPIAVDHVWRSVLDRFRSEIRDALKFSELYDLLSCCKDIGNTGEPRKELEYLARHFSKPVADFDLVIAQAIACGLARQQGRYVELQKAFGRHRFAHVTWPRLSSTAADFVEGMPTSRMKERFIDRTHECDASTREQIASNLIPWFRERFNPVEISLLQDRGSARLFAAFTELHPTFGLAWLRSAIDKATSEDLLAFDGQPDGSGFWRGRRNLVWLCEHLAQFPEHFWTCEAILLRLALHENEERVSNNSQGVWKRLFRPMFSWSAIPFDERFDYLVKKLKAADINSQPLVLAAAMGAVFDQTGEMALPEIVGGRLVPTEWRPATNSDLYSIRAASASRIIDCARSLEEPRSAGIRSVVIANLGTFLRLGCIASLTEWFDPETLDEQTLRELRKSLDEYVNLMRVRAEGSDWLDVHPTDAEKDHARKLRSEAVNWQRILAPNNLASRLRDVTGRYFGQHNSFSRTSAEQTEALYTDLAREVVANPPVIDEVIDWFDSSEAHSVGEFGRVLGRTDKAFALFPQILQLLVSGRGTVLVSGYLFGVRTLIGALPSQLCEILNLAGERHPSHIFAITLQSDVSETGFNRLVKLAHRTENASLSLEKLAYGFWSQLLNTEMKAQVIETLSSLGQQGDAYADHVALDLILLWGHEEWKELPDSIAIHTLLILEHSLTGPPRFRSNEWLHALRKLPSSYDKTKLKLVTRVATDPRLDVDLDLTNGAENMLHQLAEKSPKSVMEAIGERALDPETRVTFFYRNFAGLFDAIGLDLVKEWVGRVGERGALAIARHLFSPMPTVENPTQVPPLTEWLLSEFEDSDEVFSEFCAGRHAGQICFGSLSGIFEGTEERMQPYLTHKMRRIREWAQFEIANAKGMRAWDVQHEAEFGRV